MADSDPAVIATVLFDADGVLQTPGEVHAHFERQHGWEPEHLDAFLRHLFQERLYLAEVLTGATDPRDALAEALPEWGWKLTVADFLREWFTVGAVPDQAALRLVAELRQAGVRCALASNQDIARAAFMDQTLGYRDRFDERFYSCVLGFAKPDPDYFQTVLAALSEPPERVLFIDDQPANVAAARECGLHAEVLHPGGRLADVLAGYRLPGPVEAS